MTFYKKLLGLVVSFVFIFLSLLPTYAIAGGLGYTPTPPAFSGIYFEGNVGFLVRNWEENLPVQNYITIFQGRGAPFGTFNHGKGGFVGGLVIGYQWNKFFGAEIGWNRFVTTSYFIPPYLQVAVGSEAKFRTWMGYFALKFLAPFYADRLFVFGKIGAADMTNRVKLKFIPMVGVPQKGDFWAPLFAFGFYYLINWNWSVNFQYMFIPGLPTAPLAGNIREAPMPPSDIVTVGLGYKLTI